MYNYTDAALKIHTATNRLLSILLLKYSFLAAMSSSRSDDVTKSVCLWGVILFRLEHSKHLKLDITRVFQGCLLGVSMEFQGCLPGVSMVYHRCLKGVSSLIQVGSKGDPMAF